MKRVICDLDGVVYSGSEALPGSDKALDRLISSGFDVWFATNNSTRTPSQVAKKVASLTGVWVPEAKVITSALAAATYLGSTAGPALVVGGPGIFGVLEDHEISTTEDPLEARVVVVGLDPNLTYQTIARAADAIRNGAAFVATNTDPTYPTPTGPLPGAGAVVAAVATASGIDPTVAGKPHPPMKELLMARIGKVAWVIGDRVETDIVLAESEPGWRSILVLSGVTGPDDDVGSAEYVVSDLISAVDVVLTQDGEQ